MRTEVTDVHRVRAFVRFHGMRQLLQMGEVVACAFQGWHAQERHVSVSTPRHAPAVLLLLKNVPQRMFGYTLPWTAALDRPQHSSRLLLVLMIDEVRRALATMDGSHTTLARSLDPVGPHITMALQLRVKGIACDRPAIVARAGQTNGVAGREVAAQMLADVADAAMRRTVAADKTHDI